MIDLENYAQYDIMEGLEGDYLGEDETGIELRLCRVVVCGKR